MPAVLKLALTNNVTHAIRNIHARARARDVNGRVVGATWINAT